MHHPTDRIIHTTAFVTPVVEHWLEREILSGKHATTSETELSYISSAQTLDLTSKNQQQALFKWIISRAIPPAVVMRFHVDSYKFNAPILN